MRITVFEINKKNNNDHSEMPNLAKNLKSLMSQANMKSPELAKKLGIPYNTIHRILTGTTTDPKFSTLNSIANYFNVSLDALITSKTPNIEEVNSTNNIRSVPILSWDMLTSDNCLDEINPENWALWHPIPFIDPNSLSNKTFAIKSKVSMQPRFPTSTIFIVDPETKPVDGDLVILRIENNKGISMRELIIDPPYSNLKSILPNIKDLALDASHHKIIGVVIYTMIDSRR